MIFSENRFPPLDQVRGQAFSGSCCRALRSFPTDLVNAARTTANDVLGELAGKSPGAQKVHDSYIAFRDKVAAWSRISTQAVLEARGG
jgi:TRAP-type mannitol/chloroaromatic compound transport system substrate-binding protein